jgi:hypothetical protein
MGIAVKRHAVRRQATAALHAFGDPRLGLMRQAIEDIGVEAVHAARADLVDRRLGDFEALIARPMVFWISSSKSCTPMEARFMPAAASASSRSASISLGSISTEKTRRRR